MYKQLIVSLFLVLVINTGSIFAQVTTEDSLALVEFYDSTNGIYWTNFTNWKTGPVSTWYGVFVDNGRVTGLELPNNGLAGTIPASIGNLDSLETLYLNQNQLTGSIPSSIGNLTNLRSIRFAFNQLTGSIPPEIGSLSSLLYLNLEFNQLSGLIPSEIGNLTNLIQLHIYNNQLTDSIPSSIGDLTNLELLYLFNNQLSGSIPASIGNLTNLTGLRLFNNQLTGSIPPEIGDLSNLLVLYLTSNQLTDSIPSGIGNLSKLRELYLEHNQFIGVIPSSFVDLTDLTTLYIHDNGFTDLPDISSLISLDDLRVQDNKLTFEDIEPNIEIPGFLYSPQDSVEEIQYDTITADSNFTISVTVGGDNNQYQWKKDESYISGANDSSYTIFSADSSDAGSYTCEITNTVVTELTLYSRPMNVTVKTVPKEIIVISPNGGEDWEVDSMYDITWTSNGPIVNVEIEYSTDNGSNWSEVIASITDTGVYTWTIPDSPSDSCLIRINDTDGDTSDESDSIFTISSSSAIPEEKLPEVYSMSVKMLAGSNKFEVIYRVPEKVSMRLGVYNINGMKIKEFSEEKMPGIYSKELDLKGSPAGTYFIKMEANGKKVVETKKVVLVR